MDIPLVIAVDENRREWILKLKKSVFGMNQASEDWFDILKYGLERMSFHQYQAYRCIFYKKESVILTYVDGCVIV